MTKILIIDDDCKKTQRIRKEINSQFPDLDSKVEHAADLRTAKVYMIQEKFDIVIVDIQIAERFGDTPQKRGGLEFIKEVKRRSNRYYLPLSIIGLTQFEENFNQLQRELSQEMFALIQYEETNNFWSESLANHIKYIIEMKERNKSKTIDYKYDVGIICALKDVEEKAILQQLDRISSHYSSVDEITYYTGVFQNDLRDLKIVVASTNQMGMVPASVLSMKMVESFRPKTIICSGILAGVKEKVNVGDIIIADPSWDYGSGKFSLQENKLSFEQNPNQIRVQASLISSAHDLSRNQSFLDEIKRGWVANVPDTSLKAHVGPVATGSAVIANSNYVNEIVDQNRKLIGLEMETYGVYYAVTHSTMPKPNFISIKSVSDFGDIYKNDIYQQYAAYTSAKFIKEYCIRYLVQ